MKSFKQFVGLFEEEVHHATVIPLTGFSPISHMGHAHDLGSAMRKLPGEKTLGMSSKDKVFSPEERTSILQRQWKMPELNVHHTSSGGDTIANAFHALPKTGKKVLHILVGHDRKEFAQGLKKSLEDGKIKEMGDHKWDEIHIHHPEDSDRSHGLSGTSMRQSVASDNLSDFHNHIGKMFSKKEASGMFSRIKTAIKSGALKVKR